MQEAIQNRGGFGLERVLLLHNLRESICQVSPAISEDALYLAATGLQLREQLAVQGQLCCVLRVHTPGEQHIDRIERRGDDGAELFREGVISALEVCIVLTERLVTVGALILAAQQIVSGYSEIVRHLAEQGEIWLFALGLVAGDRSALFTAEAGKLGLRQIFLLAERDQPFRKLIHTDVPP